jgi:hypothetical protein
VTITAPLYLPSVNDRFTAWSSRARFKCISCPRMRTHCTSTVIVSESGGDLIYPENLLKLKGSRRKENISRCGIYLVRQTESSKVVVDAVQVLTSRQLISILSQIKPYCSVAQRVPCCWIAWQCNGKHSATPLPVAVLICLFEFECMHRHPSPKFTVNCHIIL